MSCSKSARSDNRMLPNVHMFGCACCARHCSTCAGKRECTLLMLRMWWTVIQKPPCPFAFVLIQPRLTLNFAISLVLLWLGIRWTEWAHHSSLDLLVFAFMWIDAPKDQMDWLEKFRAPWLAMMNAMYQFWHQMDDPAFFRATRLLQWWHTLDQMEVVTIELASSSDQPYPIPCILCSGCSPMTGGPQRPRGCCQIGFSATSQWLGWFALIWWVFPSIRSNLWCTTPIRWHICLACWQTMHSLLKLRRLHEMPIHQMSRCDRRFQQLQRNAYPLLSFSLGFS